MELTDDIGPITKDTAKELAKVFADFAHSCALAEHTLQYLVCEILGREKGKAYCVYLYANATRNIAKHKYRLSKWYNSWYYKKKYFIALTETRNAYHNYIELKRKFEHAYTIFYNNFLRQ